MIVAFYIGGHNESEREREKKMLESEFLTIKSSAAMEREGYSCRQGIGILASQIIHGFVIFFPHSTDQDTNPHRPLTQCEQMAPSA